ncbi:hypothetical protein PybrP1_011255 [[Pythium] brassicae (nom. inval.)]|nr:hypothetical protein PybrP1_011255 [[Pythium] brassicae (nom. inval.)]
MTHTHTSSVAWLAWANAGLFAAQLYVNGLLSRRIGPMSRQHETLITPAPYAFSIWGVIYTLLALFVVVDCGCPSLSIFATAVERASLLRAAFALTCTMNVAWVALFSNGYINASTGVLVVLWLALFTLYAHILADRRARGFSLARYLVGELPIVMYFAWTCAATLISVAVTLQDYAEGFLSLAAYLMLLAVLAVAALSAVVYEGELAFGLVAVWALVAIAVKELELKPDAERTSLSVRASAAFGAAVIAAGLMLMGSSFCVGSGDEHERLERAMPFLSEKNALPDYGSST